MSRRAARIAIVAAAAAALGLWVIAGRFLRPALGAPASLSVAVGLVAAASLALGWTWSGRRRDAPAEAGAQLARHLALAAGWMAALPLWGAPLVVLGESASRQAGAAPAAVLLFAVPFALLGSGLQAAVEAASGEGEPRRALGRELSRAVAGGALGGGVVGLLALPWLGVSRSLIALALLLFLALLPGMVRGRGARVACGVLLVLCASYPLPLRLRGEPALRSGYSWLDRGAGRHARIDAVEKQGDGTRLLLIDGAIWSHVPMSEGKAGRAEAVVATLGALRRYETGGRRALVVGLGAGALARALDQEGWRVTVAERDRELVRVAREHFGLAAAGLEIEVGAIRPFLRHAASAGERFDLIAAEPAPGSADRERLHNLEAYAEMRALLTPRGVLALVAAVFTDPPRDALARRLAATAAASFEHVEALDLHPERQDTGELSRLLLLASEAPPRLAPEPSIEAWPLAVDRSSAPLEGSGIRGSLWSESAAAARQESRFRLGAVVLLPE